MEKELFLKLYKEGHFNFDYFDNCDVCNTELCRFYNDIMLTKKKNFNKIDALFDLVNISNKLNSLNQSSVLNEEYYNDSLKQINRLSKRNIELKQQLADKEKEIEKITKIVAYRDDMDRSTVINGVKFSNEQIITLQNIDYFADKHNQDKISFAVEQLENVKELCIKDMTICENYFAIEKILDNQIKQLKEGN